MKQINEEWVDIPGYEGHYQISNFGNARSLNRYISTPRGVRLIKGVPLKLTVRNGYYAICVHRGESQKTMSIHRVVALLFVPNPENKPQVNHKDANKLNNHISNLEWATPQENTQHASAHNLLNTARGTQKRNHLLNEELVREIKTLLAQGLKSGKVAKKVNVLPRMVYAVKTLRTWAWVK